MEFVDIHSHYAWGIDDGIPSLEDAKTALAKAKVQNVKKIVATPHITPATTTTKEFTLIEDRILELQKLAKEYDIDVYSGCEIMLNSDYLTIFDDKQYLTINNSDYILVEFNVTKSLPDDFEERLYELGLRHNLIIAHVERYFHHGIDLDIIQNWFDRGYILQMNCTSLLGAHGSTIEDNAYQLLENGFISVIANDVHRCNGKRGPQLLETYDILTKKYQSEAIDQLMYDNPLKIIQNQSVEPVKVKKRSKLSWLKRRK